MYLRWCMLIRTLPVLAKYPFASSQNLWGLIDCKLVPWLLRSFILLPWRCATCESRTVVGCCVPPQLPRVTHCSWLPCSLILRSLVCFAACCCWAGVHIENQFSHPCFVCLGLRLLFLLLLVPGFCVELIFFLLRSIGRSHEFFTDGPSWILTGSKWAASS